MLTQQPNQGLPEIIRVKSQKGFYAPLDGKLELVNPGDVVDIPRALAMEMRGAGKAYMVEEELKRQKNYLPAYAKTSGDPLGRQLALLTEAVAALTALAVPKLGKP